MKETFDLLVTYADYRQDFVAEIWLNDVHVAEIHLDKAQQRMVEIFPVKSDFLLLNLDNFIVTLQQAVDKIQPQASDSPAQEVH